MDDAQTNRIKSLTYDHPDQIPVSVGILPAAWMRHREALDEVVARHPTLFPAHTPGERDYDAALDYFAQRQRRYGHTGEQIGAVKC